MSIYDKVKQIKRKISILLITFRKKETPWYAKAIIGITIAYALSPIDLIPDFIPILGYLDDLVILPILIMLSIKLIPKDVLIQSENELVEKGANKPQKRWYFGVPIVILWIIIILLLIKGFTVIL